MGMTVVFDAEQNRGDAQHGAARLEATGGSQAVVAAGFQSSALLAQRGIPGQDYCRVETDGRYVVGALADGFSDGDRPDVLPRWVVRSCVEFLGDHCKSPPPMAALAAHLNHQISKLQNERLSGEGCELGAFVYDQAERRLYLYLVSRYDGQRSRERATPVIAAVRFPTDGQKPAAVHVQKASLFSELGLRNADRRKTGSGEMCRFEDVDGFMLSSDGFHWPEEGKSPNWVDLRAMVCDGTRFMDNDSLKRDDRSAIFVGDAAAAASVFFPIGDVLTVTEGGSSRRAAPSDPVPRVRGTPQRSGPPARMGQPTNPRSRTSINLGAAPAASSWWKPWHVFVGCLVLGLALGVLMGLLLNWAPNWAPNPVPIPTTTRKNG